MLCPFKVDFLFLNFEIGHPHSPSQLALIFHSPWNSSFLSEEVSTIEMIKILDNGDVSMRLLIVKNFLINYEGNYHSENEVANATNPESSTCSSSHFLHLLKHLFLHSSRLEWFEQDPHKCSCWLFAADVVVFVWLETQWDATLRSDDHGRTLPDNKKMGRWWSSQNRRQGPIYNKMGKLITPIMLLIRCMKQSGQWVMISDKSVVSSLSPY